MGLLYRAKLDPDRSRGVGTGATQNFQNRHICVVVSLYITVYANHDGIWHRIIHHGPTLACHIWSWLRMVVGGVQKSPRSWKFGKNCGFGPFSGFPPCPLSFPPFLSPSPTSAFPPSLSCLGWLRGTAVERRSLAGELSQFCARPVADGWLLTNQANSAFHSYEVDRWVVSCNWIYPTSVRVGAVWWTLTKERQAWCICR